MSVLVAMWVWVVMVVLDTGDADGGGGGGGGVASVEQGATSPLAVSNPRPHDLVLQKDPSA